MYINANHYPLPLTCPDCGMTMRPTHKKNAIPDMPLMVFCTFCGCDVSDIAVYPYDPIRGGNNMRDANRIDRFCDELKAIWHCVPDWRFGQLMSNMLGAYVGETGKDIFFPEDDEMFEFFAKYVHGNSPLVKPE